MTESFSLEQRTAFLHAQEKMASPERSWEEVKDVLFVEALATVVDTLVKPLAKNATLDSFRVEAFSFAKQQEAVEDLLYSLLQCQSDQENFLAARKKTFADITSLLATLPKTSGEYIDRLVEQQTIREEIEQAEKTQTALAHFITWSSQHNGAGRPKINERLTARQIYELASSAFAEVEDSLSSQLSNLTLAAETRAAGRSAEEARHDLDQFTEKLKKLIASWGQAAKVEGNAFLGAAAISLSQVLEWGREHTLLTKKIDWGENAHPELVRDNLRLGSYLTLFENLATGELTRGVPVAEQGAGFVAPQDHHFVYEAPPEAISGMRANKNIRRIVQVSAIDGQEVKVKLPQDYYRSSDLIASSDIEINWDREAGKMNLRFPDGQTIAVDQETFISDTHKYFVGKTPYFLRLGNKRMGQPTEVISGVRGVQEKAQAALLDQALGEMVVAREQKIGLEFKQKLWRRLYENLFAPLPDEQLSAADKDEVARELEAEIINKLSPEILERALVHPEVCVTEIVCHLQKICEKLKLDFLDAAGNVVPVAPEWYAAIAEIVSQLAPAHYPQYAAGKDAVDMVGAPNLNTADRLRLANRLRELSKVQPIEVVQEIKMVRAMQNAEALGEELKRLFGDTHPEWCFTKKELDFMTHKAKEAAADKDLREKMERILLEAFAEENDELAEIRQELLYSDLDAEVSVALLKQAGLNIKVIPMVARMGQVGRAPHRTAELFVDISHGTGPTLNLLENKLGAGEVGRSERVVIFLDEGGRFNSAAQAVNEFLQQSGFWEKGRRERSAEQVEARKLLLAFVDSVDQFIGPAYDSKIKRQNSWEHKWENLYGWYENFVRTNNLPLLQEFFLKKVVPLVNDFRKRFQAEHQRRPTFMEVKDYVLDSLVMSNAADKKSVEYALNIPRFLQELPSEQRDSFRSRNVLARTYWGQHNTESVAEDLERNGFVLETQYGRILLDPDGLLIGWQAGAFGTGYDGYARYHLSTRTCLVNITGFEERRGKGPTLRLPYAFLRDPKIGEQRMEVVKGGRYAVMPPNSGFTTTLEGLVAELCGRGWEAKIQKENPRVWGLIQTERATAAQVGKEQQTAMQSYTAKYVAPFRPFRRDGAKREEIPYSLSANVVNIAKRKMMIEDYAAESRDNNNNAPDWSEQGRNTRLNAWRIYADIEDLNIKFGWPPLGEIKTSDPFLCRWQTAAAETQQMAERLLRDWAINDRTYLTDLVKAVPAMMKGASEAEKAAKRPLFDQAKRAINSINAVVNAGKLVNYKEIIKLEELLRYAGWAE